MNDLVFTTDHLLMNFIIFASGFFVLIKGSDWFIEAVSQIARKNKIPEIIIGLTLVSIGTSLPELGTNVYASVTGAAGIAFGNIIGSNITNIFLILGIGVFFSKSIKVSDQIIKKEGVFLLLTYFIFCWFIFDPLNTKSAFFSPGRYNLTQIESGVLAALFIFYILYLVKNPKRFKDEIPETGDLKFKSPLIMWGLFFTGLVMVFGGAKMVVDTATHTAKQMNIPEAIIAATVVSFGTSIPELAVTISGILKKKNDIALGNIIGSCLFNILLVLGVSGLIRPIELGTFSGEKVTKMINTVAKTGISAGQNVFVITSALMLSGILLYVFMYTRKKLEKHEGMIFMTLYAVFIGYNIYVFSL